MKQPSLQQLATQVAGKRRSLENAILRLAKRSPDAGMGAAQHSCIMLDALNLKLRDDEIDRLRSLVLNMKLHTETDAGDRK